MTDIGIKFKLIRNMNEHGEKLNVQNPRAAAQPHTHKQRPAKKQPEFIDNRPEALIQRQINLIAGRYGASAANHNFNNAPYIPTTNIGPIQRVEPERLKSLGEAIDEMSENAPEAGVNMWTISLPDDGPQIILLGTIHNSLVLQEMPQGPQLVQFLQRMEFSKVFTEIETDIPNAETLGNLEEQFREKSGPEPDKHADRRGWMAWKLKEQARSTEHELPIRKYKMDDIYKSLALSGSKSDSRALETEQTRDIAAEQSWIDRGRTGVKEDDIKMGSADQDLVMESIRTGNEKSHWKKYAEYLKQGIDIQNIEERNDQWVQTDMSEYSKTVPTLWIVGASHLPGLILRFGEKKAKIEPIRL